MSRVLSCGLAATLIPFGLSAVAPTAAQAATLPGGLGPCLGADCPATFPPVNNGPFAGRDAGINVFVGGDFTVRGTAAEAEGHVVTLGNFDLNKSSEGSSTYNVGIAGVGSRVPPPDGADFLTTGGNVSVAAGQRLLADNGVVRHAGTATGTITGTVVQDDQAVAAYTPLRSQLQAASECYAGTGTPRPATGTAVNQGFQTLFTGDNTSSLQVFNVDFDLTSSTGGAQGVAFAGIPTNATILINLVGGARTVNTYSGSLADTDPWNQLREHILWNVPTASSVTLTGTGQFQGSVLVGDPGSSTTVNMPGVNGRFFTTGSLTHTSGGSGGSGTEFHSYPFSGDLPDCGNPPAPTASTSVTKVDSASGNPLAGATFQLWRESNDIPGLQADGGTPDTKIGSPCTTHADGRCSASGLPLGTYYWEETAAPPGYDLPNPPVTQVVLDTDGQDAAVTVRDTRTTVQETASTTVTKVDAANGDHLAGAVFQLWRESNGVQGLQTNGGSPDTKVGAPCSTPANGQCSASGLPLGTYYWQEVSAPDGFDLPGNSVTTVVLDTNGQQVDVTVEDSKTVAPTGSTTVTKVDSATGEHLAGAVFQLWRETNGVPGLQTNGNDPDTKVGSPCTTPANGQCSASGLPLGTYYWQEVSAPVSFSLPGNAVTTVVLDTNGQQVDVTVEDTKTVAPTGSTTVTKVDSATGEPVAGAIFQLWRETNGVQGLQTNGNDPDTQVGSPCTTPANGQCSASGLPLGTYYWQEVSAPDGYDLPDPAVTTVVIDTDGQSIPVTVKDAKTVAPTGSTTVTKVDAVTGDTLAGAVFQLWRESNGVPGLQTDGVNPDTKVGSPCVTPNTGECSADNLPLGTYYWEETAAPGGYDLPVPAVFPVVLDTGGQHVPVTVKDARTPVEETGSTTVTKVDSVSGDPLAGAVFQLWRESNGVQGLQTNGGTPDTKVGAPCTTPANGECSANGLPLGTYYWQEVSAPDGYDLPDPSVTQVDVVTNGQHVPVTVKDTRTPVDHTGSTTVTKVDSAIGRPLAGAVFQLWRESNGVPGLQTNGGNPDTKVGSPCTTPVNGQCSAADLPLGTYYWQETAAPDGYDLPVPSVFPVVLHTDGQHVAVRVKDTRTPVGHTGSTTVTKVDSVSGDPLAGAVFQLWRETNGAPGLQTDSDNPDTKVGAPCTTPANGVCSADNLPLGTYYWQEVAAPDGFDLPTPSVTQVDLARDGQHVPVTVKDTRTPVDHTGSTTVTKVDSATGKPLAGAVFQLWRETNGVPGLQTNGGNPDTKVGAPCTTPANGVCSADNLPLGTYYWQEVSAPEGFDLPKPSVFTLQLSKDCPCVAITVKDTRKCPPTPCPPKPFRPKHPPYVRQSA